MANVVEIHVRARDRGARSTLDRIGRAARSLRGHITSLARPMLGLAGNLGAVLNVGLVLLPLLGKLVGWLSTLWQGAIQSSPALLGFAASIGLVVATLKQIGPAIVEALSPIGEAFARAGERAAELAAKGIRPLAAEFAKLNMPHLSEMMNRIAEATNGIVRRFLEWGTSTAGIEALRSVTSATADAFERLSPAVSRFVESLGNMLGRIAEVTLATGSTGLAGVLVDLAERMDRVTPESVAEGFDKLERSVRAVRDVFRDVSDFIRQAIDIYRLYRTEFGLLADALGVLAIAFGGPLTALVAAVSLVVRHFDELRAAGQAIRDFFTSSPPGTTFMDSLREAANNLVPALKEAWQEIWDTIGPILEQIWRKIRDDLLPTLGEFLAALSPIAAFFVDILGPIVKDVMENILGVIQGALDIIIGIIKVFTGILTGDWGTAWEGIKQIAEGIWDVLVNGLQLLLIARMLRMLKGFAQSVWQRFIEIGQRALEAVTRKFGEVINWFRNLPGWILSALGNLGRLLFNAGVSLIGGLLAGIVSKAQELWNYVKGIASRIASLKGPLPKDLRLLEPAGEAIMRGLHVGLIQGARPVFQEVARIAGQVAQVVSSAQLGTVPAAALRGAGGGVPLPAVAADPARDRLDWLTAALNRPAEPPRPSPQPVRLELRTDGSALGDALLEILRRAIRAQGGNVQEVLT